MINLIKKLIGIFAGVPTVNNSHLCNTCKKIEFCDFEECTGKVELCNNCSINAMLKKIKEDIEK